MASSLDLTREHDKKAAGGAYGRAAATLAVGVTLNDEDSEQASVEDAEAYRSRVKSAPSQAASPNEMRAQGRDALDRRDRPPFRELGAGGEPKSEVLGDRPVNGLQHPFVWPNVAAPAFSISCSFGIVGLLRWRRGRVASGIAIFDRRFGVLL